jgi:hypothetical protein
MSDEREPRKGIFREITETFKDKLKELKPMEAALVYMGLCVIGAFTLTGMTAAIASGVVKLIQMIGIVVSSGMAG